MPTHTAFLRGMNLGGRRITNDDLCSHFTAMGFSEVAAFLASGNVVFAAESDEDDGRLARRIEAGLKKGLDYAVPTFVRTAEEVRAAAGREAFPAAEVEASAGKLQVAFLASTPSPADRDAVLALATDDDRLAIHDRELYWLPAGSILDSALDLKAIDKHLGASTTRTANTVKRLAAKFF